MRILVLICILLYSQSTPSATAVLPTYIRQNALAEELDPYMLYSLCLVESHGNPFSRVIMDGSSPSYGLCQLKLSTARLEGYKGTPKGLYDPEVNSLYAAKYLHRQLKRYGNITQALSAYNAGHYTTANNHYVHIVFNRYYNLNKRSSCGIN